MAIDFPPNAADPNSPSNGDTYVDSASGTEWEYNATNNSWTIVSSSAPGGGAFVYIGEHDFTQAAVPSPPADAGYVYSQSDIGNTPGNVNGVYNGIAGDTIIEGTLVLYTGSSWTFMSTTPGYPNLGDGNGDTLDTRYVRTQGDNTNVQTITGAAGLKTNGLLESGGGVKVSGGNRDNISKGFVSNPGALVLSSDRAFVTHSTITTAQHSGNVGNGLNVHTTLDFSSTVTNANVIGVQSLELVNATDTDNLVVFSSKTSNSNSPSSKVGSCVSFLAATDTTYGSDENIGFKSGLYADDDKNYNFYAINNAPSFFKGDTYIGGDVSRSTFDLWKSTLTEEQLEQLEAGTLAAPANVSTPGDGSFARAWYYDQQDAETQAALDSGELEYPTHLSAATFTDTFALGDNTNITLASNGLIKGGGVQFTKNWPSSNVESRGIVYSSGRIALLSTNRPDNDGDSVDVFLARVDPTEYDDDGNRTAVNIGVSTTFKSEPPLGNPNGTYGSFNGHTGFIAQDVQANDTSVADWTGVNNIFGFRSEIGVREFNGKQAYNFYASGSAPNYFAGPVMVSELQDLDGTPLSLPDNQARETFRELQVAVKNATDFGELKAAMLVALEDYKNA